MFDELTHEIADRSTTGLPVVVGITGFPGGGKSTLADNLVRHFGLKLEQIIHLDSIYMPEPRGGYLDDYDWKLLEKIVDAARAGNPKLQYIAREFGDTTHGVDEPMPKVLVVEGVWLFRPETMDYFDVSVWVDCPFDFALARAKARDKAQGRNEAEMQRWDTEWAPMSRDYFQTYHPDRLASFIFTEYK